MSRYSSAGCLTLIAGVLSAAFAVIPARAADAVADFYKGKTVTIIVGFAPGGAYDVYARILSRFVPKYLPGNPTVVVQNMPGAAAMTAANYAYNVAPQDGTVMASIGAVLLFQPLFDPTSATRFDVHKANWLPSPTSETNVVSAWHTSPLKSFLDARDRDTVIGTSGVNSSPAFYGRIFNDVFKTRFKMVHGFVGGSDQYLAMERGEIEVHPSSTWTSVKGSYSQWIAEGKLKILLQFGAKPTPDLPNVPFARDLATSEDDKLLLDVAMAPGAVGRPYMMGPSVPPERVTAMRKAIMDSLQGSGGDRGSEEGEG
jgi:tripartite-type tricarboxylate transporter receptor subunit TctC